MKVSIITIVYNNKSCIGCCLESVRNQSYANIEHIVIDGGSTDGTQNIISEYKKGITYYKSEKDSGLYDALNKGIKKATGDVIGILHSDDIFYENTTVEKVVNEFEKSQADLIYAKGMYVDKQDISNVKRIYPAKAFSKFYMLFGWIPLHTTIYVKRELFEKYGNYDLQYSIASDYDISLRWFKEPAISKHYLKAWVVKMRLGGKSTSANLQKLKSTEDLHIIRKHKLLGWFTLVCKIARKIPQYLLPKFIKYGSVKINTAKL